ncbi:MAG TPA: hypothetical protein VF897_11825 [Roseiflexaceae bacterium]
MLRAGQYRDLARAVREDMSGMDDRHRSLSFQSFSNVLRDQRRGDAAHCARSVLGQAGAVVEAAGSIDFLTLLVNYDLTSSHECDNIISDYDTFVKGKT